MWGSAAAGLLDWAHAPFPCPRHGPNLVCPGPTHETKSAVRMRTRAHEQRFGIRSLPGGQVSPVSGVVPFIPNVFAGTPSALSMAMKRFACGSLL